MSEKIGLNSHWHGAIHEVSSFYWVCRNLRMECQTEWKLTVLSNTAISCSSSSSSRVALLQRGCPLSHSNKILNWILLLRTSYFLSNPDSVLILAVTLLELKHFWIQSYCKSGCRFRARACLWPPSSEYTVINDSWDRVLPSRSYSIL